MSEIKKQLPRVDLPPGTRLDTLAVREGLPPSQWGENSEALYLTSSFVHPDAATAAARFANDAGSNADRQAAYGYLFSHLGEYLFLGGGFGSSFSLKNSQVIPSSFENAYAMLVVDIGLPDGDGFSLTQQLRAMPWPPRVVLISSDSDRANEPAARRSGACGFVPKDELSDRALWQLLEEE